MKLVKYMKRYHGGVDGREKNTPSDVTSTLGAPPLQSAGIKTFEYVPPLLAPNFFSPLTDSAPWSRGCDASERVDPAPPPERSVGGRTAVEAPCGEPEGRSCMR